MVQVLLSSLPNPKFYVPSLKLPFLNYTRLSPCQDDVKNGMRDATET